MLPKAKILIADDDERILKVLVQRFSQVGIEVMTATDGFSALWLATQHLPDALVLDINMPAGDGFSVQERIRGLPDAAQIPVIYMTGDRSERLDDLAQQLGAVAILHKPFHAKKLVEIVLGALAPPRLTG